MVGKKNKELKLTLVLENISVLVALVEHSNIKR
jgi:hypothetical protein